MDHNAASWISVRLCKESLGCEGPPLIGQQGHDVTVAVTPGCGGRNRDRLVLGRDGCETGSHGPGSWWSLGLGEAGSGSRRVTGALQMPPGQRL